MADFKEIIEVGMKVREKYNQDPDQDNWFNDTIEYYNENGDFPEGTDQQILQYLESLGDSESINLSRDIARLIDLEDSADNILLAIFFEQDDENQEEEEEEEGEGFITEEDPIDDNGPQKFFDEQINKLSATLSISYDLSYLLLKNNGWSPSQITNVWFQSQDQILKSLNIQLGSPNFPKIISPLTAILCKEDTCPICYEDKQLLQLYCGHKLCAGCLASEITELVNSNNLPICRAIDENSHKKCCSEIIPSDVFQYVTDQKVLDRYIQIRLKSECEDCPDAKVCSACKTIITKNDEIGCHTGQCPNCHFAKCLKCQFEGSHSPLVNCKHISEFTVDIKNKMKLLDQAQTLWYMREERLRFYRRNHQNEFLPYFDNIIAQYKKTMSKIDREELDRIAKAEADLRVSEDKLSKALSSHSKNEEVEEIQKEVELNKKIVQRSKSDHKIDGQDRQKYLTRLNKWKQYYIWSITEERHPFQNGILKFKKKLNRLINQSSVLSIDEDKNTEQLTKKCPKCGFKIYKQGGCHYVQCGNCHYAFCWICEQKWEPPHGDHHVCPIYSLNTGEITNHTINGINYDDPNDTKFYPLPLDLEKAAEFTKWNNSYMEYNKNSAKYEQMIDLFAENNKKDSVRDNLIKSLMSENSESTSIEKATKILNDVLFAQSVIVWGYPQMFYMSSNPVSYMFVEYSLIELEALIKNILDVLKSGSIPYPTSYLESTIDTIMKKIQSITKTCECF